MLPSFTLQEIQLHNHINDCWLIINNNVYDVTEMIATHPGGIMTIINKSGQDCSQDFFFHSSFDKVTNKLESILK